MILTTASTYEAPTLARLLWAVLKHRAWHLVRGDG